MSKRICTCVVEFPAFLTFHRSCYSLSEHGRHVALVVASISTVLDKSTWSQGMNEVDLISMVNDPLHRLSNLLLLALFAVYKFFLNICENSVCKLIECKKNAFSSQIHSI